MQTLRDLRDWADERFREGDAEAALLGYCAGVQREPLDLEGRQRIGDCLLVLGEPQRAAVVYTAVARYATHAGYPLRALVALKILTAMEPQLEPLLGPLAELYSSGSARLGRAVRPAPPSLEQPFPPTLDLSRRIPLAELAPHAERVASDLTGAAYPEFLPPVPLLSALPSEAFRALLPALQLRRAPRGAVVIAEGQEGQSFFVIARGEVEITKRAADGGEARLATLSEGAIFGEMALVSAAPRSATVRTTRDTDLLEFDRAALAAVASEVATIATALDQFTRQRLLQNLLQTSPLFRPLDRDQRIDLMRRFSAHDLAPGVPVVVEGTPGRGLFVLLAGEVDVSKIDGSTKVLLATLGPGEVFGEISLLSDDPATATVTTARQSTVLFLAKEVFARLATAFPEIREYVEQLGQDRMLDTRLLLEAGGMAPIDDIEIEVTVAD